MSHRIAAAVNAGIAVAALIFAILVACTPQGACAPTPKPVKPAATKPATVKPAPRPTVTVTKHSTYKIDIDHDDDHC